MTRQRAGVKAAERTTMLILSQDAAGETVLAKANALLVIPSDRAKVDAGESIDAMLLRSEIEHVGEQPIR